MSEPIRTKPKSSMKIDNAPTPHNTPVSVLGSSFLKNGNPVQQQQQEQGQSASSSFTSRVPQTVTEEDVQSVLTNQPFLLQSIQDKLGSLVGQDSGYVEQLPRAVKERIFALKSLQNDLFKLEKDFQIEMFELERKYLAKYAPLHDHRYKLIIGDEEPTANEIAQGKKLDEHEEEEEEEEEAEEEEDIKGIPSFWLTALENLPIVSDTITDRDAEVLDFLTNIKLQYLNDGKPGFQLVFQFDKANPFFKNSSLTKTYYYQKELGYSGDFIYDHAEGEEIQWTDNNSNVTITIEMRKQRNKTTKQIRVIEKITPVESFFNFFDPPKMISNGEEEEDKNEEELQDLEERLALDYSIGEQIKDKLIPRAVDWFTGAALEFEFDNEEEEEEDEFPDQLDEEDDEEDDQEQEETDDFAAKNKEQPPECKQS